MTEPAYRALYRKIKGEIEKGIFEAGSFLPSEAELEAQFGVSRTTVRRAMKMLADDRLIEIRQGRGTMVSDSKTPQSFNSVTSVTESLRQRGYKVETKSRYIDRILPPEKVAEQLRIPADEPVVRVQRVQTADGIPMCIMTNYIPERLVPGLSNLSEFVGLYHFLETHYGFEIGSTDDTISAAACDFSESQILDVPTGAPILIIERVCYDRDKKPLCVDKVRVLANKYKVRISTEGRNR